MKRFVPCLLLAVSLTAATPSGDVANSVVVIVNDAVITLKDVMQYMGSTMDVLTRTYAGQPEVLEKKMLEAQRDGIEQLVERKLILQEFKTAGYNLPESVIDDKVQERMRERYGDWLTATRSLQEEGLTREAFRQRVREDYIISAMRAQFITREIIVSPYKIEKYYAENLDKFRLEDRVRLHMMFLPQPSGGPPGTARRMAEEILTRLAGGVPFVEMARVYSPTSQQYQGRWVERKELKPELANVAFALKPRERSQVVELPEGCYLMEVEDVSLAHTKTLPEVREEIDSTLLAQERARLTKKWIERLKAKAFVRYF